MQRNAKSLYVDDPTLQRLPRAWAITSLFATLLLVVGIWGPAPLCANPSQAAEPPGGMNLRHVPADAGLVVVLDVPALAAKPDLPPIVEMLIQPAAPINGLIVPLEQVEQITLVGLRRVEQAPPITSIYPNLLILQTIEPQDWNTLLGDLLDEPEEVPFEGRTYLRSRSAPAGLVGAPIDERTILMGRESAVQSALRALEHANPPQAWVEAQKHLPPGQIMVLFDAPWLRRPFEPAQANPNAPAPPFNPNAPENPWITAFPALFDKMNTYAISLDVLDGLQVDAIAMTPTNRGAERVAEDLGALLVVAENVLNQYQQQHTAVSDDPDPLHSMLMDAGEDLLEQAKVLRVSRFVRLHSEAERDLVAMVKMLQPAVATARNTSQRTQSINHLKRIGLALHNYHAAYGHFPPAVLLGPDGETTYSWRVAILPFLEQNDLYNRYKFDEPWDGPNNRELLEEIPAVYQVPEGGSDPTHADYFVLTGPDAMFSDEPGKGVNLAEVRDGTSNTIAVVETKREIPWTKPEDIPYAADQPMPELGGFLETGFNVVFADGSVQTLRNTIHEQVLRALITKAGGEVINRNAF